MEGIPKTESRELRFEPISRAKTDQINPEVVFSGRNALHASVGRGLVAPPMPFTALEFHHKVVLSRIRRTSLGIRSGCVQCNDLECSRTSKNYQNCSMNLTTNFFENP